MTGWVYILANKPKGTIYVGATGDLVRRIWEHRQGLPSKSFSSRYATKLLVYYEPHGTFELAEKRERAIKHWVRQWKVELIEGTNPHWEDLWPQITQ